MMTENVQVFALAVQTAVLGYLQRHEEASWREGVGVVVDAASLSATDIQAQINQYGSVTEAAIQRALSLFHQVDMAKVRQSPQDQEAVQKAVIALAQKQMKIEELVAKVNFLKQEFNTWHDRAVKAEAQLEQVRGAKKAVDAIWRGAGIVAVMGGVVKTSPWHSTARTNEQDEQYPFHFGDVVRTLGDLSDAEHRVIDINDRIISLKCLQGAHRGEICDREVKTLAFIRHGD